MSTYRLANWFPSVSTSLLFVVLSPPLLAAEGRPCTPEPTSNMPISYGDVIPGRIASSAR